MLLAELTYDCRHRATVEPAGKQARNGALRRRTTFVDGIEKMIANTLKYMFQSKVRRECEGGQRKGGQSEVGQRQRKGGQSEGRRRFLHKPRALCQMLQQKYGFVPGRKLCHGSTTTTGEFGQHLQLRRKPEPIVFLVDPLIHGSHPVGIARHIQTRVETAAVQECKCKDSVQDTQCVIDAVAYKEMKNDFAVGFRGWTRILHHAIELLVIVNLAVADEHHLV